MAPDTDTATDTRPPKPAEAALTERALLLLARREHSRVELRRKLLRGRAWDGRAGGHAGTQAQAQAQIEQIDELLDDFVARGLLSDMRFAESFVRRGVDRGQGPLKIRAGLRGRGVAEDIIDDALTFSDDFWLDRARAAQSKRFGINGSGGTFGEKYPDDAPASRSEWAKRARFLAGRGFASDIIYRTLGPQTV